MSQDHSAHEPAGVSWSVAVVHAQSCIAHCRASQRPGRYRSRVAACCETGAGFASARSNGRLNRTDTGNLAQQFRCFMLPALRQELGSHLSPQGLQSIQLLIEQIRSPPHAGLWELAQPFLSSARSIDLGTGTRNAPAAIQCLQAIHHARQIFADGLITAPQLA